MNMKIQILSWASENRFRILFIVLFNLLVKIAEPELFNNHEFYCLLQLKHEAKTCANLRKNPEINFAPNRTLACRDSCSGMENVCRTQWPLYVVYIHSLTSAIGIFN